MQQHYLHRRQLGQQQRELKCVWWVWLTLAVGAFVFDVVESQPSFSVSSFQVFGNSSFFGAQVYLTTDTTGANVYVADRENSRIVSFSPRAFDSSYATYGAQGSGSGQFSLPSAVRLNAAGNQLLVSDSLNYRVVSFDPNNFANSFSTVAGGYGAGVGQISQPVGLAVPADGSIWVANEAYETGLPPSVIHFNPNNAAGTWQAFFNGTVFTTPAAVYVANSNTVYVLDRLGNRVGVFNPQATNVTASLVWLVSGSGSGTMQFSASTDLSMDSNGWLYVADRSNNRIVRFDPNQPAATFSAFGTQGTGQNQFDLPSSVYAQPNSNNVWVGDFNRIVLLNVASTATTAPPITTAPTASTTPAHGNAHSTLIYSLWGVVLAVGVNLVLICTGSATA